MDNKVLLIIMLPILFGVIWFIFIRDSSSQESTTSYKRQRVVDLPDGTEDTSRVSKVNVYKEQTEKERYKVERNDDFYSISDEPEVKSKKVEPSKPSRSSFSDEEDYQPRVSSSTRVKKKSVEPAPEVVVQESKPVVEESGFGISRSESFSSKTNSGSKISSQEKNGNEFFSAYLEDNTKVKNRQMVVFILSENATIEGHELKKNSILFGKASDTGSSFDIKINQAKLTDGSMVPLRSTYVYNEYYSKGIAHSGKMTKAMKESGNNTIEDISSDASSTVSMVPGADLAVSAVDNTIKAMSRQKENEISLAQGYKIYIKSE